MHNLIVVTRPNPQGAELCTLLRERGRNALHFPTINIQPLTHSPEFVQNLTSLAQFDWLIFISPQAVYMAAPAIRQVLPVLPITLRLASLGPSTTLALQAAGYYVSAEPIGEWNSENLLRLPAFQAVQGKKIAIVCGEDGRDLLDETLTARGATVTKLIAYRRTLPQTSNHALLEALNQSLVQAIVCTSFSCVENLQKLCQQSWNKLQTIPLIVPSERVKNLALGLGFQTIWLASNASHAAMIKILDDRCSHLTAKET